jgi:hypothetical protein
MGKESCLAFVTRAHSLMSSHGHPKLDEIDEALIQLEPLIDDSIRAGGFVLTRSHEHSYNVPRRWLQRTVAGICHQIGLVIASPMPERLERGFYPEIPVTLYVAAFDREAQKHYDTVISEAQPFVLFRDSLRQHLADAIARLDTYTPEFIAQHGVDDATG